MLGAQMKGPARWRGRDHFLISWRTILVTYPFASDAALCVRRY